MVGVGAGWLVAAVLHCKAPEGCCCAVSDALRVLGCVVVHHLHACPGGPHVLAPGSVCLLYPLSGLGAGGDVGEGVELEGLGVTHDFAFGWFGWLVLRLYHAAIMAPIRAKRAIVASAAVNAAPVLGAGAGL